MRPPFKIELWKPVDDTPHSAYEEAVNGYTKEEREIAAAHGGVNPGFVDQFAVEESLTHVARPNQ
jgi:hypothetical protein